MGVAALTSRRVRITLVIGVAAAVATIAGGASASPRLKEKQAEAREVLGQIQALDTQLGLVGEQLDGARYELQLVQKRERKTGAALVVARRRYAVAQQRIATRLVTLYDAQPPSTADAVLGASSLSAILARLQLVHASDSLDRQLVREALARRATLDTQQEALVVERQKRGAAVAAVAAHERTIGIELAQRRRLLASVQSEVAKLQREQAIEQARLAAEARARLAAEAKARAAAAAAAHAAAERAAQARARAAAATAQKATPPPTTTTTATTPTTPATTVPATTVPGTTTTAPTTTSQQPQPPAPTVAGYPQAATIALQYLGIPYVFGGASPTQGFDCSGLVMYVYAQLGIQLPHYAAAQYTYGVAVPRDDLQPGDLVFFEGLGHVGIYIGDNELVDAPHTGAVVSIETLGGWYAQNYVGARRL